jgi:hypothetical protein
MRKIAARRPAVNIGRRRLSELTIVGLAIAAAVIPVAPDIVERFFSTTTYPWIQRSITPLSNLTAFAVLDVLSVVALAVVVVLLVRATRSALREHRIQPIAATLWQLLVAGAATYLLFLLLWGFNYRRTPMTARLVVEGGTPTSEAVVMLGVKSATQLDALYDAAHRAGWDQPEWQNTRHRAAFAEVTRALSDAPEPVPGRFKRTLLGSYFRWAGVDGMTNPFGLETLVNPDLLPFERPFIAAHEWAHLAGYADESEANFIAWLTCVRGDVPAQYSGWLALYWQVSGEVDEAGRKQMAAALAEGPRRDLNAVVARLQRGEVRWLQVAGWAVYDKYLKANRVEGGVRSYGAVVTLILRAQFRDGWMPVRRVSGS